MDTLKSLMQPLAGSSVIDGMKLVVLGGTVETARRVSSSAWSHFVNCKPSHCSNSPHTCCASCCMRLDAFFLTAHFSEEDSPYDWLMLWLSRRPEWQRSREFETTTRASTRTGTDASFGDEDNVDFDADLEEDTGYEDGRPKTRVVFQPTFDTTHTIYYRGHWLRVRRGRKTDGSGCEMLSISVVARNNSILKQLVLQAKREYEAESVQRVQIYFAASYGSWSWTDSRHKRPMSSIVLNPGVKEMLLADTRDFLRSEQWYADRGIPFRRGYLLHGVPGSGKSSLIHAIAGELMLDIYVVSLSSSWISDSTLTTLMGRVPSRCILLLEDLDAAFTRSVTRDKNSSGNPDGDNSEEEEEKKEPAPLPPSRGRRSRIKRETLSEVNTLSLSGLLNALDGVAAAEGRLLFATTNHLERLDPALSRPGRMDVWIEFKNSSKWQAEALFRNFFPSMDSEQPASRHDQHTPPPVPPLSEADEAELAGIELPSPPSSPPSSSGSTLWSLSPSFASSTASLPRSNSPSPQKLPAVGTFGANNQAYLPPPVDSSVACSQHSAKPMTAAKLAHLAKMFADAIPDEEFSVAALQGYLLKHKSNPDKAAEEAETWVVEERIMKERLKKEKEEKERKREEKEEKKKRDSQEKKKKKAEAKKKEAEEEEKRKVEEEEKERAEKAKEDESKENAPPPPPSAPLAPVVELPSSPPPDPIPFVAAPQPISVASPPSIASDSDSDSSSDDEDDELSTTTIIKPNSVGWGSWH